MYNNDGYSIYLYGDWNDSLSHTQYPCYTIAARIE